MHRPPSGRTPGRTRTTSTFFGDYLDDGYRARTPTEFKELPPIENTLSTGTSLSDHLLWQLRMQADDDLTYDIGTAVVGNLDEDGRPRCIRRRSGRRWASGATPTCSGRFKSCRRWTR